MNLLSVFFLFGLLFLCSSAPTPEECKPLVTPLSLADPTVMFGKVNFLVGYTSHDVYRAILKITDSSWVEILASQISTSHVVMEQMNKINGTCLSSSVNVALEGNRATASLANINSQFHVLPSCDGCLVFLINSTAKNIQNALKFMQVDNVSEDDEIHAQALYLLGTGLTVNDSDLENFKKQASCLGFSGEPDFHYNPEKSLCQEGEGFRLPY